MKSLFKHQHQWTDDGSKFLEMMVAAVRPVVLQLWNEGYDSANIVYLASSAAESVMLWECFGPATQEIQKKEKCIDIKNGCIDKK